MFWGRSAAALCAIAALLATGCGSSDEATSVVDDNQPAPAQPGEPPTKPPDPVEGIRPEPPEPIVLASGRTAQGEAFEYVIYGTSKGPCLTTMYPQRRLAEGGGACGDEIIPAKGIGSPIEGTGSSESVPGAHVTGFITTDVSSVKLSFDSGDGGEETDAAVGQIPKEVLHQVGGRTPLGVFIAYLPDTVQLADVTATAYDIDGEDLGTTSWPDFPDLADSTESVESGCLAAIGLKPSERSKVPDGLDPCDITPVTKPNRIGQISEETRQACASEGGDDYPGDLICDMVAAVDKGLAEEGEELSNQQLHQIREQVSSP